MAIVDEIERIKTNIANAYTALEEKGATLPTERNSDNLSAVIVEVPTGSGDVELTNSYMSSIDTTRGANCTKLPDGITSIGDYAFYQCTNLALTKLPDTVHYFRQYCFAYCTNLNIHEIGPSPKIKDIVSGVGSYAFQYCKGLTDIKFTEGVGNIDQNAFDYCTSLTKVDLPSTMKSLSANVFRNCTSLKTVICRASTPPSIQSSSFLSTIEEIYVPDDKVTTYKIKTNWSAFSSKIKPLSELEG